MVLQNWFFEQTPRGSYVITGNIYGDEKGRFEDGTIIHTSKLESVDFLNGIAKTLNSTYHLGSKKER